MSRHRGWIEGVGCIAVASACASMLAQRAQGDLVGTAIGISPEQHPEQRVVTLRVYLVFDDQSDCLQSVIGDDDILPLLFETDGAALHQNCQGQTITGEELCVCDFRSHGDLGGDSWVNLGLEIGDGSAGGGIGPCDEDGCCIVGSQFGCEDLCGYFDPGPGTREHPDDLGRIPVAQFSLPDGTCFTYQGTAVFDLRCAPDRVGRAFQVKHCVCLGDLDVSGAIDFDDLLQVLTNWGPRESCPPHSPADLDKDCEVGFSDLLIVLSAWGPCE